MFLLQNKNGRAIRVESFRKITKLDNNIQNLSFLMVEVLLELEYYILFAKETIVKKSNINHKVNFYIFLDHKFVKSLRAQKRNILKNKIKDIIMNN